MLQESIQRDKVKKPRKQPTSITNFGLTMCVVSVVLALMTALMPSFIISEMIYGIFGIYVFAILLLCFFIGLSLRFSRRYVVSHGYMICSVVMIISALCLVHLVTTQDQLDDLSFGKYLEHGFDNVTAGGVLFSIPAFVLWNFFAGLIGSIIVLGTAFAISCAFLTTFIITNKGENKVIKKKPPESSVTALQSKDFKQETKSINEQIEQKYQELLQKQGRDKLNEAKSQLGLDKAIPNAQPSAVFDAPVGLNAVAPVQPIYQSPIIQNPNDLFIQPQPPMQQPTFNPSPIFGETPVPEMPSYKQEQLFNEYKIEDTSNATSITPTSRARTPKSSVVEGQTSFENVIEMPKKKPYVKRRYTRPSLDLIRTESSNLNQFEVDAEIKKGIIDAKLKEFNINANVTGHTVAPAITRFEITLGLGTRANDVYRMENDFSIILGTTSIRMENIDGKNAIGIEVPNKSVGCVAIRELITSKEWQVNKSPLTVSLGKNINDEIVLGDIASMPHLLIAGSTGSGKSVCINTILTSLIYRTDPADLKLLLVDVKLVELSMYNEIPHMLIPRSIGEVQQAINALKWMQDEMRRRYEVLQAQGLKNIGQYHALNGYQSGQLERMPYILMVIDEAADLIHTGKREVEDAVKRLAALGRASGIHLILATQRPSADVITSVIKANMPVRIGFKTVSRGDSITIIGEPGCDKLVGRGDMLYLLDGKIQRVQGAFVQDDEARDVMNFIRANNVREDNPELEDLILNGPPTPQGGIASQNGGQGSTGERGLDINFVPILRWIVRDDNIKRTVSVSSIQRHFSLGFGRAGRIVDQMASMGYVGPDNGAKGRDVLITKEEVDDLYGTEF